MLMWRSDGQIYRLKNVTIAPQRITPTRHIDNEYINDTPEQIYGTFFMFSFRAHISKHSRNTQLSASGRGPEKARQANAILNDSDPMT